MDNILGCPWFGPHKRRRSSQQPQKVMCRCFVLVICSSRVLLIRFHLIAFLRWLLFFSSVWEGVSANTVHILAEMFGFPQFVPGGVAAVIANLVPKATRLSQDPHAKLAAEAVAALDACSWRRVLASSRDPSCRTSLARKPLSSTMPPCSETPVPLGRLSPARSRRPIRSTP